MCVCLTARVRENCVIAKTRPSVGRSANSLPIAVVSRYGPPVVAPRVGSIGESVIDGQTGFLTDPGDEDQMAARLVELIADRKLAEPLGHGGRAAVQARWSLETMVDGYERLIAGIYERKAMAGRGRPAAEQSWPEPPARNPATP